MKVLKWILIVVVILVGVPLIVAIFVKKDFAVVREVTVNKPKQEVFDYIKLISNQNKFNVWIKKDPNAVMESTGTDGTVGYISKWDSKVKEVGKGEQEITSIKEGDSLNMALHFYKPMDSKATAFYNTEAIGANQTKVKWGFNGKMAYPMNFMLLFVDMDKMLGKDLQAGLDNLKTNMDGK